MIRLSIEEWKNILNNLNENDEEVEIIYLDDVENGGEYCLSFDCEFFEDGFLTENQAYNRLQYIINEIEEGKKAMEKRIKEELNNLIDDMLCNYMQEYKVKNGDVTPSQCFELENNIENISKLLNDIINQNM